MQMSHETEKTVMSLKRTSRRSQLKIKHKQGMLTFPGWNQNRLNSYLGRVTRKTSMHKPAISRRFIMVTAIQQKRILHEHIASKWCLPLLRGKNGCNN